ncbi:MAG: rod shape-determining protein MreC [Bacteroidia bacterium]
MRNLFLLIWKYYFFILFVLFEFGCVYLIIKNNNYHRSGFINSSNKVAAEMLSTVNSVNEFINLRTVNEHLARENAEIMSMLPESSYSMNPDSGQFSDTLTKQHYIYITAKVINNSTNRRNNYLTLDKGSLHGIEPEMGVVSSTGLVGIVKDVSEHFCTVKSVLHKQSSISAKLKGSGFFGSLIWRGSDPTEALLQDIPKNAILAVGDSIVTTGYSTIFPEGLMIGTVKEHEIKPGDNFHSISINLATNFHTLSHVYVIENLLRQERITLEANLNDN